MPARAPNVASARSMPSRRRVLPIRDYADAGARIAPEGSWTTAPGDAIIFGLKELPADGTPLPHRHVMFGHAFKGQRGAETLLGRFRAGGGRLYDIEYLVDEGGRRLAAFGYWAGFAGAAVSLKCWAAQQRGGICGPVLPYPDRHALTDALRAELDATGRNRPTAIVIARLGVLSQALGGCRTADPCRHSSGAAILSARVRRAGDVVSRRGRRMRSCRIACFTTHRRDAHRCPCARYSAQCPSGGYAHTR